MKFSEFKKLIETRQKLIILKEKEGSNIENLQEQITNIEYALFGSVNFAATKINKIFYVSPEKVRDFLEDYFENKCSFEIGFSGYYLELHVVAENKLYNLGVYDLNQSLKCLYSGTTQTDWDKLLETYPDLKDFLWKKFKEYKVDIEKKEISIIKRKLGKNDERLEFLQNPSKIKTEIETIQEEQTRLNSRLNELNSRLEEICCD